MAGQQELSSGAASRASAATRWPRRRHRRHNRHPATLSPLVRRNSPIYATPIQPQDGPFAEKPRGESRDGKGLFAKKHLPGAPEVQ